MPPFIENVIFDSDSSSALVAALQPKFVEVGALMEKMWKVVVQHRYKNKEKIAMLKAQLCLSSKPLTRADRSWALGALDKASVGGSSAGGSSAGGMMSGSNISGGPTSGLRLPRAASESPPLLSVKVLAPSISSVQAPSPDLAPTTGSPLPERPEHASH